MSETRAMDDAPEQDARAKFGAPPSTPLGRWSARAGALFVLMFLVNSFVLMPTSSNAPWRHRYLPYYGIAMLLVGLAAGVLALVAVIRQRERSWLTWLTLLPGAFVIFLLLGEFLVPH